VTGNFHDNKLMTSMTSSNDRLNAAAFRDCNIAILNEQRVP